MRAEEYDVHRERVLWLSEHPLTWDVLEDADLEESRQMTLEGFAR